MTQSVRTMLRVLRNRGLSADAAVVMAERALPQPSQTSRLSARAAAQEASTATRMSGNRYARATQFRLLARSIQMSRNCSLEHAQREADRILREASSAVAVVACADRTKSEPPLFLFSRLSKDAGDGRVWIQLAQIGTFKGHPQGPFELTPQVFDSICRNFTSDGLPLPIDFEHASELPPNSGSVPSAGAPAIGWIHSLDNRGAAGLWGQVEWLEPARSYIREGKYKFISPAIRFKSKDRVSGRETGPRLSSAGVTNAPFLSGLQPLVATWRP